ncbi:carcinine hydrolase/isopenicillin-N N-acyltransferase family protein [Mesoterricola silvestris]|uniref:Peptidase C45 hydrolase domain-containing protein n=1 Tax=Mesoterricola silvestris TaxID=2927979 RepID=A0AA48GXI0_9BACT|nr:carcinine hydrolase/isopenicillin-N N-acyltransferase family protein [Mesoterricola silvestris]BDU72163.1 hypothetical protein METEAL_13370 [Mesoterricola silvestris]
MKPFAFPLRITLALALGALTLLAQGDQDCTAAVISPAASENHRPLIWKNRDTKELSNRVVYVQEAPHSYIAVVDKDEPSGHIVWAGVNTAGFAIMNTASYNLQKRDGLVGDGGNQEGVIMALALRKCATVEDFEALLNAEKGPGLNVTANFGVLDAAGKAFIYEANSKGFKKFDTSEAPGSYMVLTNFSRSGKENAGAGYLRFERATELARQVPAGKLSPRMIFRDFARDTGHVFLHTPIHSQFREGPAAPERWIHNKFTINRWDTACTVVLVGKDPGDPASRAMMWILPGEPMTAVGLPLWPDAGITPEPFWKGEKEAPLWAQTMRIKRIERPFYGIPEKQEYMNISKVDNREGTGFLPRLLAAEKDIFDRTDQFLRKPRTPAELAAFQNEMAGRAMEALESVR